MEGVYIYIALKCLLSPNTFDDVSAAAHHLILPCGWAIVTKLKLTSLPILGGTVYELIPQPPPLKLCILYNAADMLNNSRSSVRPIDALATVHKAFDNYIYCLFLLLMEIDYD